MRVPRDLSGKELAKKLGKWRYKITRQTGSHLRLTIHTGGEHHITIPQHAQLRVGTLNNILSDVAVHFGMQKDELMKRLFKN